MADFKYSCHNCCRYCLEQKTRKSVSKVLVTVKLIELQIEATSVHFWKGSLFNLLPEHIETLLLLWMTCIQMSLRVEKPPFDWCLGTFRAFELNKRVLSKYKGSNVCCYLSAPQEATIVLLMIKKKRPLNLVSKMARVI